MQIKLIRGLASKLLFQVFLSIFIIFAFSFRSTHSFYVSVTNLKVESNYLKIEHRIFLSDMEMALRSETGNEEFILNELNIDTKKSIVSYLAQHFVVNQSSVASLKLESIELKKEGSGNLESVIISYFFNTNLNCYSQLKIKNSILIDVYDAQVNMLHYKCDKNKKSKSFNKRVQVIVFD